MNVDKLVNDIVYYKNRALTYDERIEIIQNIFNIQSKLPLVDGEKITAVGLQTLKDIDLVLVLQDTYTLFAINFFLSTQKKE